MKKAIFALIGMIAMLLAGCAGSSSELDKAADNGRRPIQKPYLMKTVLIFKRRTFNTIKRKILYPFPLKQHCQMTHN